MPLHFRKKTHSIYSFLAALGLCYFIQAFSNCGEQWRCRRRGFDSGVRKIPWRRRKRQTTLVFILPCRIPQRNLAGYSLRGRKRESATTEVTEQNTLTQTYLYLFINRLTDLSNIICLISSNPKSHEFILSPRFPPNSPRHFKALWRSYWQEGYKEEVLGVFPPPANGPI